LHWLTSTRFPDLAKRKSSGRVSSQQRALGWTKNSYLQQALAMGNIDSCNLDLTNCISPLYSIRNLNRKKFFFSGEGIS
jgi:hypothetical protein